MLYITLHRSMVTNKIIHDYEERTVIMEGITGFNWLTCFTNKKASREHGIPSLRFNLYFET